MLSIITLRQIGLQWVCQFIGKESSQFEQTYLLENIVVFKMLLYKTLKWKQAFDLIQKSGIQSNKTVYDKQR